MHKFECFYRANNNAYLMFIKYKHLFIPIMLDYNLTKVNCKTCAFAILF